MTSMLRGGKNDTKTGLSYDGCSCHNSKAYHRKAKKSAKGRERKQWQRDADAERASD